MDHSEPSYLMTPALPRRGRDNRGFAPLLRRGFGVGVAWLVIALALAAPVAAVGATFTPNTAASELMRLLNGERTTHGLPALAADSFLAYEARDGAVACPDGSGTVAGRAKDMATHNFLSHALRLCPTYDVGAAMRSWGYASYLGEIIASNTGYNFNPFPYQYGCDVHQANCDGAMTSGPTTVAIASYQYMTSQGHRDVVLSTLYDRFACGAWQTAYGSFYACMFASGPGTGSVPTAAPAAIPTPVPTSTPTLSPTPTPTPMPPNQTATPMATPGPTPIPKPAAVPAVTPLPTLVPASSLATEPTPPAKSSPADQPVAALDPTPMSAGSEALDSFASLSATPAVEMSTAGRRPDERMPLAAGLVFLTAVSPGILFLAVRRRRRTQR